ncbi:MAG: hypothetical protein HFJ05_01310 [Eubacterium sp.]|nr:hypothetical protein [Eubacterium sp.]
MMFINLDGPTFLLLILLAIILAGAIQGKRGRWKRYQYDERQEIVRGRGFQYGFAAMAAALILQAVYTDWLAQFFSYEMLPLLCLCIGILVNTVYIILHDGYFPVNEHPMTVFFCLAVLFLSNLFQTIHAIRIGVFVQDGEAMAGVGYLILAVIFLIELLAILCRFIIKRKEKEE